MVSLARMKRLTDKRRSFEGKLILDGLCKSCDVSQEVGLTFPSKSYPHLSEFEEVHEQFNYLPIQSQQTCRLGRQLKETPYLIIIDAILRGV